MFLAHPVVNVVVLFVEAAMVLKFQYVPAGHLGCAIMLMIESSLGSIISNADKRISAEQLN